MGTIMGKRRGAKAEMKKGTWRGEEKKGGLTPMRKGEKKQKKSC